MAAQDFSHCSQSEGESVSDFIRRLERTFRLAYGHDKMLAETCDALLHSQLQEGLRYHLMEAPAVSGASTYPMLCHAAKNEERRQAKLKKRKQYQANPASASHYSHKPFTPSVPNNPPHSSNRPDVKPTREPLGCWNCEGVGHVARDCRKPRKERAGHRDKRKPPSTKMVQSAPITQPRDDPLQYLFSSDSDDPEIRKGIKTHCVKVSVQGVPLWGVVDSAADITIIGGEMFKQVVAVAKLRKKDFKPPDQAPCNYDQQPLRLDGRMDLDISFLDKAMKTAVYVKVDACEPSEGVCQQMGIISYHPEVKPRKVRHISSPGPEPPETVST